ncbi:M18 family aminopeptidase [Enemella sp. A6]|uniref:M18 family aminopeptidase n=1 Tax=Enemella sp. A6 TaxID=3440152 RepID=UPI003EB8B964
MATFKSARDHTGDLGAFVAASPSSYHAVQEVADQLRASGFSEESETKPWTDDPGGHFLIRDGAIIAWRTPTEVTAETAFRIVGSHTDSPAFKLKPRPDKTTVGWQQVGVEVYGGMLTNSWLDRELGLAGRIVDLDGEVRLVRTGAVMRVPQLAIHLDRAVNSEGLKLDPQQHLTPVWGIGDAGRSVLDLLAEIGGLESGADIAGHDVFAYDTQAARSFGADLEFLASGRLDNLMSVHASLVALIDAEPGPDIQVMAAFDHEEVGSASTTGAAGPLLAHVLQRIAAAHGIYDDAVLQMCARSSCLSADGAHGVHPNYVNRHDPDHLPMLNAGPVLKLNANQRYATDAVGSALWRRACRAADVPSQEFVSNNAMPCGSTIGPLSSTRLGIRTVDVGAPMLSMHSAREMCGVDDPHWLSLALRAYWEGA